VEIIGISVSKNYAKELSFCIDKNCKHFTKWFIVTQKDDTETIKLIESKKKENIKIIYYPLVPGLDDTTNPLMDEDNEFAVQQVNSKSDTPIKSEIKFDKGGAIRYVQKYLIKDDIQNTCILILDSDIILPNNLKRNIKYDSLKENVCYGAKRNDFLFSSDLLKNKNYKKYHATNLAGYFQLYKADKSKLYKRSYDCSFVDYEFLENFDDTEILKVEVKHLGLPGVNWEGKKRDSFIDDTIHDDFVKSAKDYDVNVKNKSNEQIKETIRKRIVSDTIENSSRKYQFPNLIVPGFKKCGSYSLKQTLSNHNNIMFPHSFTTELNYCVNEKYHLSNWHNTHMWYLKHFQRDGTVWCDHSHDLLNRGSKISIDRLRTTCIRKKFKYAKDVKFIVMIRNPIDRAYAEYKHGISEFPASYTWDWEKPGKSFEENINAELDLIKSDDNFIWNDKMKGRLIINGIYEPVLKKLIQKLELTNDTLLVVSLENLVKNTNKVMNKIFDFLEAEHQEVCIEKEHNYSETIDIENSTHEKLENFYLNYTKSLENLLGEDYGNIYKWW